VSRSITAAIRASVHTSVANPNAWVRWRIEQAEEFRQEVERYTDADWMLLTDAYQG
jgi:hypothetical protein